MELYCLPRSIYRPLFWLLLENSSHHKTQQRHPVAVLQEMKHRELEKGRMMSILILGWGCRNYELYVARPIMIWVPLWKHSELITSTNITTTRIYDYQLAILISIRTDYMTKWIRWPYDNESPVPPISVMWFWYYNDFESSNVQWKETGSQCVPGFHSSPLGRPPNAIHDAYAVARTAANFYMSLPLHQNGMTVCMPVFLRTFVSPSTPLRSV